MKDVTETVTQKRYCARCDGCGQEVPVGQPIDPHVICVPRREPPADWCTVYKPSDTPSVDNSWLACSRACLTLLIDHVFGEVAG